MTSFTSHKCSKDCGSFDKAIENHRFCASYSCRYLHGYRAIIDRTGLDSWHQCKLCFCMMSGHSAEDLECGSEEHAETHSLRSCAQTVFTNRAAFIAHLIDEHEASWHGELDLVPWRCSQILYRDEGQAVIYTTQDFENTPLCCTNHPVLTRTIINNTT
jgi:hypothetical protein